MEDWLSAFYGGWEISTHHLDVVVETLAEIVKRQQEHNEKTGQKVTVKIIPHLSSGEKLGTLMRKEQSWHKLIGKGGMQVTSGWTVPIGKPSKLDQKVRAGVNLKSRFRHTRKNSDRTAWSVTRLDIILRCLFCSSIFYRCVNPFPNSKKRRSKDIFRSPFFHFILSCDQTGFSWAPLAIIALNLQ